MAPKSCLVDHRDAHLAEEPLLCPRRDCLNLAVGLSEVRRFEHRLRQDLREDDSSAPCWKQAFVLGERILVDGSRVPCGILKRCFCNGRSHETLRPKFGSEHGVTFSGWISVGHGDRGPSGRRWKHIQRSVADGDDGRTSLFAEPSGDACDHYHLYHRDIALLKQLGFDTYRFSIEWARIEPEEGFFSSAALDHYRRMIARAWRRASCRW